VANKREAIVYFLSLSVMFTTRLLLAFFNVRFEHRVNLFAALFKSLKKHFHTFAIAIKW